MAKKERTTAELKAMSLKRKRALIGYSFIAPNFIGFAVFILFPVLFTILLSVMDWDGFNAMQFAGLSNFEAIFRDRVFKSAFWKTLLYVVFTVVLTLLASLGLACALNKKIRGRDAFRAAIFFPYVASMIAVGAVWKQLFEAKNGPINHMLMSMGIDNPPGWFASTSRMVRINGLGHLGRHHSLNLEVHGLLHAHLPCRPAGYPGTAV